VATEERAKAQNQADMDSVKEAAMELQKVNDLLVKVSLDHSGMKPEEALKNIAAALLHIAQAVDDLQRRLPTRGEYF
jgi:hypothetical protein